MDLLGVIILVVPAVLIGIHSYPFVKERSFLLPALFLSATFLLTIILFIRRNRFRLELIVISILLIKITFNWVVIPERLESGRQSMQRELALQVAEITENRPLLLDSWTGISHETSFYISRERSEILKVREEGFLPEIWYIRSDNIPLKPGEQIRLRFETRWKNRPLRLVSFINPAEENY